MSRKLEYRRSVLASGLSLLNLLELSRLLLERRSGPLEEERDMDNNLLEEPQDDPGAVLSTLAPVNGTSAVDDARFLELAIRTPLPWHTLKRSFCTDWKLLLPHT